MSSIIIHINLLPLRFKKMVWNISVGKSRLAEQKMLSLCILAPTRVSSRGNVTETNGYTHYISSASLSLYRQVQKIIRSFVEQRHAKLTHDTRRQASTGKVMREMFCILSIFLNFWLDARHHVTTNPRNTLKHHKHGLRSEIDYYLIDSILGLEPGGGGHSSYNHYVIFVCEGKHFLTFIWNNH